MSTKFVTLSDKATAIVFGSMVRHPYQQNVRNPKKKIQFGNLLSSLHEINYHFIPELLL